MQQLGEGKVRHDHFVHDFACDALRLLFGAQPSCVVGEVGYGVPTVGIFWTFGQFLEQTWNNHLRLGNILPIKSADGDGMNDEFIHDCGTDVWLWLRKHRHGRALVSVKSGLFPTITEKEK